MKSANRSHILRPLRAAFAEYTGPIPFFVVPRLDGHQERREGEKIEVAFAYDLYLQRVFLQLHGVQVHCHSSTSGPSNSRFKCVGKSLGLTGPTCFITALELGFEFEIIHAESPMDIKPAMIK